MHFNDHSPPHFHAHYGEKSASIRINDFGIFEGELPAKIVALVIEWTILHRDELLDNWERGRSGKGLKKIKPLVNMSPKLIKIEYLHDYTLRLSFADGSTGEYDFAARVGFKGVFTKLRDQSRFRRFRISRIDATLTWSGNIDLDRDVLYADVTGKPIVWNDEVVYQPNKLNINLHSIDYK